MTKSLKEKAIDIKGKKYVQVADRVLYFNETYPNGSIFTKILSPIDSQIVVVEAQILPDAKELNRTFTGHSQATIGDGYINKTSALENAETSAVGRALAMMGIGVIESIASVDEIHKANYTLKANPTVRKPNLDTKVKVAELLLEVSGSPFLGKEEYTKVCKEKTGLELKEENYDEILERLTIIKNEKNS